MLHFEKAKTLFASPLIAGASVSAGYLTKSPAHRAAELKRSAANITTIARSGTPGVKVLQDVARHDLAARSLVVGLDLFFWDATLPQASDSLAGLHWLVTQTERLGIPLVLGDVPGLLPALQPQRQRLNGAIHDACATRAHCHLFGLDAVFQEVLAKGTLEYQGRRWSFWDLAPDGLHLSAVASEYLAERLIVLTRESYPQAERGARSSGR